MKITLALLLGLLALAPVSAAACGPVPKSLAMRLSGVQKNPDCSFSNAGTGRLHVGNGQPAVDIGNHRIAQRVNLGEHGCWQDEYLMFLQCDTGHGIVLKGFERKARNFGAGSYSEIELLQPPHGPIALSETTRVEQLEKTAEERGLEYTLDLRSFFKRTSQHKRIDFQCGCDLFYPDSPGAQS